jgi:hypothetical protein
VPSSPLHSFLKRGVATLLAAGALAVAAPATAQ